ncbi:MAG: amino acid ABC transporter permease [Candidatus Promineifilaceae bacterium]
MSDQLAFLIRSLPNLLIGFPGQRPGGLLLSLLMAVLAIGIGFLTAAVIATGRESRFRPLRWLARAYIEVFRGIPLILLLLLVYQVVGGSRFGLNWSPRTSAVITLALYTSAYQAEILRAGLKAVPPQLVDSARLMGTSSWQLYRFVRLRYAFRVMLPAFTGQAISLFKDTSVVIIIGVSELMTVARAALGSDIRNTPYWVSLYILVGALYFTLAFSLSLVARRWENRRQSGDLVHSLANY